MANTYTLQTTSYDGRYLKLTCTQTQNIAANTSTINWTLESLGGSYNYYHTGPTTVKINGVQVYYKARATDTFPAIKGSTSGTLTVNHNTDGKKAISVSLATAIYTASVSTYSGTWTMDTIPRAATLNSATNFTDEGNPTITYTNAAGANASTLEVYMYANNKSTVLVGAKSLSKTGTSFTYALTDAERNTLRGATTTNTLNVQFRIKTVIAGNTYWSEWMGKQMSIINANPTVSMTVIDNNPTTVELTGNSNKIVKGHSTAYYEITATPKKGGTIASYEVVCGGEKESGAKNSFLNAPSNVFTYTVKDSRGNTTTGTITKLLVDYVSLTCNQKVDISLTGETSAAITVEASGNYFRNSFGSVSNTLTIQYRMATNSSSYSSWQTVSATPTYSGNTYKVSYTISGLNYSNSYKIQTRAKDKLNIRNSYAYTAKLQPVFDWSSTDFNFNVPVKIGGVEIDYIEAQGISNGWYYRKWHNGIMECWCTKQITTDVNNAWGNVYVSGILADTNLTYPFAFTETPILNVNLMPFGSGGTLMPPGTAYGSNTKTGAFEITRGTSITNAQYLIAYQAIGKWK